MKANNHNRTTGFSLVELMIAMTLGLILLSGMIAVFSGNKRTSEMNTAMANIQENARFALDLLASNIRMSGYQGCVDINSGSAILKAGNAPAFSDLRRTATTGSIVVTADSWQPDPAPTFVEPVVNQAIPGTHTLTLQGATRTNVGLSQFVQDGTGTPSETAAIQLANANLGFTQNELAIIADCKSATVFRISGVANGGLSLAHTAPANTDGSLDAQYGTADPTEDRTIVARFTSNVYYVGDTGLKNEDGDRITALYEQSLPYGDPDNPPTELIQGVENLRVSFGTRDFTGTLRYMQVNDPLFNPVNVESVQIGLLMTSWDRISQQDDNNTYVLAGQTIPASSSSTDGTTHLSDRRFRLAFNTTVKVRNRREQL